MSPIRASANLSVATAAERKPPRNRRYGRILRSIIMVLLVSASPHVGVSGALAMSSDSTSGPGEDPAAPAAEPLDAASQDASGVHEEDLTMLLSEGGEVFVDNCAECHGVEGAGTGAGPRLVGNDALENVPRIARQVLFGGEMMPSFHTQLSDHQVAAVLTYVRESWGNSFGVLTEMEVTAEREKFE